MKDLKEIFEKITRLNSYQRVDDVHPLDLYVGIDNMSRWTLLMLCNERPENLTSSRMIRATIGKRDDGRWAVSLSLLKEDYQDMFILFCGDIIESSRIIQNKNKAARFVVNRYREWKDMLANSRDGLLSPDEIKGLLGEMFILDSELIGKYGAEKAAMSWTGPKAAHQDFILENTWYEVKTISSSKDEIKISSVEQLDCRNNGMLVVVFADKTSKTNVNAINLNLVYAKLLAQLMNDDVKAEFCDMLLKFGYFPRPEYENTDYTFEIKGVRHYQVTEAFPCFRRKNIPNNITRVGYYISLPAISHFREGNCADDGAK